LTSRITISFSRITVLSGVRYEALHNLYTLPTIVRVIKSERKNLMVHVSSISVMRKAYKILDGTRQMKGTLGRIIRRWEDDIKMNVKESVC